MKYFMTGITGFIGSNLACRLATDGHTVNALARNPVSMEISNLPGIKLYKGDLFDQEIISEAMDGCDVVFHLAALAKAWAKDPGEFRRINVEGAVNIFDAAKKAGVKRVVFTSSAATMSPSDKDHPADENTLRSIPFFNAYEETKDEAEEKAREYTRKGLEVVIVNPTRVFGPGPLNASNSVTKMITGYCLKKWRIIPGDGRKVGNYVYIDDVVNGHILAAEKGRAGERYILGGDNITFDEFFQKLARVTGIRRKMYHLPLPAMTFAARVMEIQNHVTGIPPLITAAWVKKYLNHWSLSSEKAKRELGYCITPFEVGVRATMEWLEG